MWRVTAFTPAPLLAEGVELRVGPVLWWQSVQVFACFAPSSLLSAGASPVGSLSHSRPLTSVNSVSPLLSRHAWGIWA